MILTGKYGDRMDRHAILFASAVIAITGIGIYSNSDRVMKMVVLALFSGLVLYMLLWNLRHFMLFYAFILPLSVPYGIGNSVIDFPSEAILVILSAGLIFRVVFIRGFDLRILKHPMAIILLLDLSWYIIATLSSSIPVVSLKRCLIKSMYLLVFFYLFSEWFSGKERIIQFFLAYGIGLVIPVCNTLYNHSQFDFSISESDHVPHPFYQDHTIYAAVLSFLLVIYVTTFNLWKKGRWSVLIGSLILLFGIANFFAFSRAAWLSLVFALMVYLYQKFRPSNWTNLFVGSAVLLFVVFNFDAIIRQFEANRSVSSREDLTEHVQSLGNVSSDASNRERINRWASAFTMFREKPVLGFGPGTYQFKYGAYQDPGDMTAISTFEGDMGNAHSEYLMALSENGLPGLVFLLLLVIYSLYYAWRLYRNSTDSNIRLLSLAVLLALSTYYFHGLVNSFIDVDKTAVLVYGSMAAIVALTIEREEKSS